MFTFLKQKKKNVSEKVVEELSHEILKKLLLRDALMVSERYE